MKLYFCLILCVVASLSHCEMYEKILCHEAPYCTRNMFWENQAPVYFIDNSTISINEDKNTIEDIYEPYLLRLGFISRTPRGRMCMAKAYEHLGIKIPTKAKKQLSLFDDNE